ncbi:MAG: hypothetical protein ACKN9E_08970 [Microcystaceae cyanobacterium]
MMTRNLLISSLLTVTLGSVSLSPSVFAVPRGGVSETLCEGLSDYMISANGTCVNLTYVNGGRPKLLPGYEQKISQFEKALAQIGVPINYQKCEEAGLLGLYNSASNRMVICELTQEISQKEIYETLVHESWHTVQDCMDGLENTNTLALSQAYPKFRQEVLGGISLEDFATMSQAYSKEKHLTESEARFMQNKPELVLEWLGRCKAYVSSSK